MTDQPDHDAFDISQELDTIQKRLKELDVQQRAGLRDYADKKEAELRARMVLNIIKEEIGVLGKRSMNLMSILRALPK